MLNLEEESIGRKSLEYLDLTGLHRPRVPLF